MKSLLIIDGSSLLSTSYYGNLPKAMLFAKTEEEKAKHYDKILHTSTGIYTNGIYGFMKTFNKMLAEQKPTHVAVVFDQSRHTTFRRELTETYKATRGATPAPLKEQFILMEDLLSYIGIPIFMGPYYEADDYAGSLTKKFEKEISVFLHTKDNDYLQLISEYSRVWLVTSKADEMYKERNMDRKDFCIPDNTFEFTIDTLKEIKGLTPLQIIDFKSITGDDSDNIAGIKGLGEKSVIPLIQEYGCIEEIYNQIEDLNEKEEKDLAKFFKEELGISRSPIKLLKEGKESAFLSKRLATIKTDIDEIQSVELDDLVLNINKDKYKEKMLELEMKSLLQI